jgi:hypothetical protein
MHKIHGWRRQLELQRKVHALIEDPAKRQLRSEKWANEHCSLRVTSSPLWKATEIVVILDSLCEVWCLQVTNFAFIPVILCRRFARPAFSKFGQPFTCLLVKPKISNQVDDLHEHSTFGKHAQESYTAHLIPCIKSSPDYPPASGLHLSSIEKLAKPSSKLRGKDS